MIQELESNHNTPLPAISPSAAEADNNEDTEMPKEMEMLKQRMETLRDDENYEDSVINTT